MTTAPRLALVVALATLGCRGVPASFRCTRAAQCLLDGVAGQCEADGACSVPDARCPSGRHYIYAGGQTGSCVVVPPPPWSVESSGSVALLRGVWGSSGHDVYVVGDGGTILHSAGDGNWSPQTSPKVVRFDGVAGASATDIYISGNLNTLLHGNGTGQWTSIDSSHPPFDILSSLFYATPSLVYAVGNYGFILHSNGQGGWGQDASGTMGWLRQIWGTAPTDLYTVGDAGTILHSSGGDVWMRQASMTSELLLGVWGASATEV